MQSTLQQNPKSKIIKHGYINIYSQLNTKELRQIFFKEQYKKDYPEWDESMVFLTKKFKELVPNNALILDAGCGNGNYVIDENRTSISWACGVDASIEDTRKNICLDEIKESNLEKLPYEENRFDAVVSLWVLEHLENPQKVFSEIHRVLKPGGVFMFATPNKNFVPLKLIDFIKLSGVNHAVNKHFFGRNEQDVFPTFYKANTLKALKNLANNLFEIKVLRLNADPSYTSFNSATYFLTKKILNLPNSISFLTHAHIVGIFTKVT